MPRGEADPDQQALRADQSGDHLTPRFGAHAVDERVTVRFEFAYDGGRLKLIEAGKYTSIREAARAEGVAKSYAAKISKMVLLAPDIIEALVEGRTDDRMMLKVLDGPLPVDWEEQRQILGA